jgi:citrate synthase
MRTIISLNRKHEKDDVAFWQERRGIIRTRKGGWIPGGIVHNHGYSLVDDLIGKASYFQVLILNVTGRLPERRLADWLEAHFICHSYPDARIWCNHIGSLAGTMQASPVAASSAGVLASDSRMYGPGTILAFIDFITDAVVKKRNGASAEEIVRLCQRRPAAKPTILGYARPVANGDERIPAMERVTRELGFARGEHLALAFEIDEVMHRQHNEKMNLLAYSIPFLCDQGFSAKEIYRLLSVLVCSGVLACYSEAADSPPESFFALQCCDIDYQGPKPREVPSTEIEGDFRI